MTRLPAVFSIPAAAILSLGLSAAAQAQPPASAPTPSKPAAAKGRDGNPERRAQADRADRPAARNDDPVRVAKHAGLVGKAKRGGIDLYFEGDSITRRWEATQRESWDRNFGGWRAADFGARGDRTQNVLYRLLNGELDGVNPKVIVLLIGTNNVGPKPPEGGDEALVRDVARGIKACLDVMRRKAPGAKILLVGITPRNTDGSTAVMPTINRINRRIARFADGRRVKFLDLNDRLADKTESSTRA